MVGVLWLLLRNWQIVRKSYIKCTIQHKIIYKLLTKRAFNLGKSKIFWKKVLKNGNHL